MMSQFPKDRLLPAVQARIFPHVPAQACLLGAARSLALWELLAAGLKWTMAVWQLRLLSAAALWRSFKQPPGRTYVLLCSWLSWSAHGLPWPADGAFPSQHQVNNHWRNAARHLEHASPALPVASRNGRSHHQHLATLEAREWELELLVPEAQLWPTILNDYGNTKLGGGSPTYLR